MILKPGGNAQDASNYRPIALLDHGREAAQRAVTKHLAGISMADSQHGFQKGTGTNGQLQLRTQH